MGAGGAARRRGKVQQRVVAQSNKPSWTPPKGMSGFNAASRAQALQAWQSWQDSDASPQASFSLNQEARNTVHHLGGLQRTTRLRDNAIQFVSAGKLGMEKDEDKSEVTQETSTTDKREDLEKPLLDEALPVYTQDIKESIDKPSASNDIDTSHLPTKTLNKEASGEVSQNTVAEQVHPMDTATRTAYSSPASVDDPARLSSRPRSTSSSSASSTQDVVIFAGRRGIAKDQKANHIASSTSKDIRSPPRPLPSRTTIAPIFESREKSPPAADTQLPAAPKAAPFEQTPWNENTEATTTAPPISYDKKGIRARRQRGRRGGLSQHEIEEEEEEALMQDYIDNMKIDESSDEIPFGKNEHHRFFDGAGEEHVKVQISSIRQGKKAEDKVDDDAEWSSDDLEDFGDMSTTDDEILEVGRVYSRRQRPTGVQYLVSAVGANLSGAKWILQAKLTSVGGPEQIRIYEESIRAQKCLLRDDDNDSSTDSEEEAMDDALNDIQSEDEENERIIRHTSKMTDEEIARLLAKQEELGMTGNELVLFNGQLNDDDDDDGFSPFSTKSHISGRTRSKQTQKKRSTFPSAEAFADALDQDPYGGFDVMEWDRPSLKPKHKGRKSTGLPFELEDSELEQQLQQSWSNDHSKKAAKKREREELRQAGLLGSKAANGRVDLKTKYKNSGMDADQVKSEIRTFLMQEMDALALAPMEAHMRVSVHRLAKTLSLKSHSQGAGNDRFPIITKTPFTPQYTPSTIWEIDELLARRKFFLKGGPVSSKGGSNKKNQSGAGPRMRRTGGGGVIAGASYMDGEVVGASAPEIGAENRGRAMLEKMGWTTGMGIGKVGNEGRTEVVKHIVKNTKAGLG